MDYPIRTHKSYVRGSHYKSLNLPRQNMFWWGLAADCPTFKERWSSQQFREFFRRALPLWATKFLWASQGTTPPHRDVIISYFLMKIKVRKPVNP